MAAPPDPSGQVSGPPPASDVTRRTWLAAERTWLAWWRTGIATGGIALAVGRLLPNVVSGARWPYRVLGLGYGLLSIVLLVIGAQRQRRASEALRRGEFEELQTPLVSWLTAAGIALAVGTLLTVLAAF